MSKANKLRFTDSKPSNKKWEFFDYRISLEDAHKMGKSVNKSLGKLYLVYRANVRRYEIWTLKRFEK